MANRERLKWIVDGMFRIGGDGNGLEYVNIGVTPWALTRDPKSGSGRKLTTVRDQFEFGNLQYTVDDALDVDSYVELSIVRLAAWASTNGQMTRRIPCRWADWRHWVGHGPKQTIHSIQPCPTRSRASFS